MNKFSILLLVLFLVIGCGVAQRSVRHGGISANSTQSRLTTSTTISSLDEVRVSLMQAYRDWKGTPYVLGGSSNKGVDCSQLVHIIFDDYFDISLPTNTRTQLRAGDPIKRFSIRTGDLIFFKTGRKLLHVGIGVSHGEFLHASTSSGVMISKLDKKYWQNRYFTARRVL